jgi:hypothetical protein
VRVAGRPAAVKAGPLLLCRGAWSYVPGPGKALLLSFLGVRMAIVKIGPVWKLLGILYCPGPGTACTRVLQAALPRGRPSTFGWSWHTCPFWCWSVTHPTDRDMVKCIYSLLICQAWQLGYTVDTQYGELDD